MTITVQHKIDGIKELQEALKQLPKDLVSRRGGVVKSALMSAALPVMRTAQNTVPNRDSVENSGRLMNAIARKSVTRVNRSKTPRTGGAVQVDGFSEAVIVYVRRGSSREDMKGAYYAPFVEFGAKGLSETNWFKSALEVNQENSLDIFRKKLATSIEKIARQIGNENARKVAARVKAL